jgi:hypothetical protein
MCRRVYLSVTFTVLPNIAKLQYLPKTIQMPGLTPNTSKNNSTLRTSARRICARVLSLTQYNQTYIITNFIGGY